MSSKLGTAQPQLVFFFICLQFLILQKHFEVEESTQEKNLGLEFQRAGSDKVSMLYQPMTLL